LITFLSFPSKIKYAILHSNNGRIYSVICYPKHAVFKPCQKQPNDIKVKNEVITKMSAVEIIQGLNKKYNFQTTRVKVESGQEFGIPCKYYYDLRKETEHYNFYVQIWCLDSGFVNRIEVMVMNYGDVNSNEVNSPLLLDIAKLPYVSAEANKVSKWILKNIGKDASLVVGGIKYKLFSARSAKDDFDEPKSRYF